MFKRFFITGTDTSVGKTVVSRALLQALAASGKSVAGYKPVAKGSKETPDGLTKMRWSYRACHRWCYRMKLSIPSR
jgi:dethiobiotin synthetase